MARVQCSPTWGRVIVVVVVVEGVGIASPPRHNGQLRVAGRQLHPQQGVSWALGG